MPETTQRSVLTMDMVHGYDPSVDTIPVARFKEKFGEVSEKAIRDAIVPLITQREDENGRG